MTAADAIERAVAGKLKALRDLAALSQPQLAERMLRKGHPWHQSTVWKIEHGTRHVRVGELADLAAILGVTPAALLSGDDHQEAMGARDAMDRALREQMAAEILSGARNAGDAA